jgi:hypothetical protein
MAPNSIFDLVVNGMYTKLIEKQTRSTAMSCRQLVVAAKVRRIGLWETLRPPCGVLGFGGNDKGDRSAFGQFTTVLGR